MSMLKANTFGSVLDAIGNTPLVEITHLNQNRKVRVYAKLENFNPGGSIKDRAALYMINGAEQRSELTKGKIILEATSGNTGIGLSLIAAAKGYKVCLAMSESVSEERKKILQAMGAELIFTPANLGTDGAIEHVYQMLRENPEKYYGTDQYNNVDNTMAHYHGTAMEIWEQTRGTVTMVVAALGTTGTAMGLAMRLKELNPAVKMIGVEPYLQHRIQGLKNMRESYRPGIFDKNRLDEKINILDGDAFETARRLAREEGLLVGMSSGAAMHVALQKAEEMGEGVIVVIFPDSGERYLSTELFLDKTQTTLRFYNSLTRRKEFFKPINPEEVLMHSCGPTVHDIPHLGSYRRFVISDLIRRYLEFKGYHVRHIMNIIDLADRSIQGAEKAGIDVGPYTQRYMEAFFKDLERLRIRRDASYPRASENVDAMVRLVERLVERGFAYEKLRSVYFDISKLEGYGSLTYLDLKKIKPGRTVDLDDYEKDSPVDFTLLKRSTLSELKQGIYFQTKWGSTRPSWHLECAAVAMAYLADTFDIHASGADIVFPHCDNVMAIGRAATGKAMANYWVNTEVVLVNGKKMSRSLKNTSTLDDLEKIGYGGREIRFLLLNCHYRKPLSFSHESLDMAQHTIQRLDSFIHNLIHGRTGAGDSETDQAIYDLHEGFTSAMDDDLNISGALAVLFNGVKKLNICLSKGEISEKQRDQIINTLRKIDSVLNIMTFEGMNLDEKAHRLIGQRDRLRKIGQWQEADDIREELMVLGIEVSDTQDGTIWRLRS
ncbi:MAG: cysteine--tRNA ligase [Syntrophales bacterium]|jgi:cysteinyl-tRNA synthetase